VVRVRLEETTNSGHGSQRAAWLCNATHCKVRNSMVVRGYCAPGILSHHDGRFIKLAYPDENPPGASLEHQPPPRLVPEAYDFLARLTRTKLAGCVILA
jgi:hypothetical protein